MKTRLIYLISLICLSLVFSSCDTTSGISNPHDQEILNNNISYSVIIRYGTPYYYNGYLNYYLYKGLYYYPVYYNNYWYFRTFRRPFKYGYFPGNKNWKPRSYMRGFGTFGNPDKFGRVHRDNIPSRRLNRNSGGTRRFGRMR